MVYALQPGLEKTATYSAVYFPLVGCCSLFIFNQIKCEMIQWLNSDTNGDYFFDLWNINDLIYLSFNLGIMLANLFGHQDSLEI